MNIIQILSILVPLLFLVVIFSGWLYTSVFISRLEKFNKGIRELEQEQDPQKAARIKQKLLKELEEL